MLLSGGSSIIDEGVSVSSDASDTADDISLLEISRSNGMSRDWDWTYELRRNIFSPLPPYPPSFASERSSSFPVTFFSAASTTPSVARTPRTVPACEIASIAYSTWLRVRTKLRGHVKESVLWYSRPDGTIRTC